ncbi:DhNV_046 [Dikerogammarus haemobaphes nudivirus]|nr:DhNV_046 [Dikerogammarus haemobaphes nudivirus]
MTQYDEDDGFLEFENEEYNEDDIEEDFSDDDNNNIINNNYMDGRNQALKVCILNHDGLKKSDLRKCSRKKLIKIIDKMEKERLEMSLFCQKTMDEFNINIEKYMIGSEDEKVVCNFAKSLEESALTLNTLEKFSKIININIVKIANTLNLPLKVCYLKPNSIYTPYETDLYSKLLVMGDSFKSDIQLGLVDPRNIAFWTNIINNNCEKE